ncbi:uncharacterized protein BP01DRAFT_353211 [Aspergillus saccharolyticus JOP 1030-1]|uniref:Myb-like domain-containing protein n=1 Tax=Aspergillus saccharolyticus JOP 1030-1 TaxID=1450539 RepID=A0A318ZQJ0_9EURO|nr:hypothetical protein BP01DRAFT_353211 [Aspergillus saccharolyticus JOP 1030-1]PYH48905.1 hypothetical protein BP01DRAFT_353211 [Aspergillus saccharolyticus JOP 1030-1]
MSSSIDDDPSDPVYIADENTLPASLLETADHERTPPEPSRLTRKATTRTSALEYMRLALPRKTVEIYADVLRQLTSDNSFDSADPDTERHNSTQDGVVIWSPQEKDILYRVLERKGKEGIREAARALGSKSEIEVQEHLQLLHSSFQRRHLEAGHSRAILLADVPAAAEIGEECHAVLENYAELLRLEEQQEEDVAGRQKHHNFWIINQRSAAYLDSQAKTAKIDSRPKARELSHHNTTNASDQISEKANGHAAKDMEKGSSAQLDTQGADSHNYSSVHLTAGLFRMENWVRLSERLFMNFGSTRLDDNWHHLSFADENPSLTADAFADFYALAVSLTRRLVQSSLFFAEARLRKWRDAGQERALEVKSRDVRTALDVLNINRNSSEFWVGLARRLSLDVVDNRHVKDWKSIQMDYDEVEDILSGRLPLPTQPGSISRSVSRARGGIEVADEHDSDSGSTIEHLVSGQPAPSSFMDEDPVDSEDDYAEYVDKEASRTEESNLWKLIGRPHPRTTSRVPGHDEVEGVNESDLLSMKPESRKRPFGERKSMEDLLDWRDRLQYRSEWEEYGHEVFDLQDEILENRRKRRRHEHEDSPSSSPALVDSDDSVLLSDVPHDDMSLIHNSEDVDRVNSGNSSLEEPLYGDESGVDF